ncbi:MAG: IS607 family transposase [Cyanomargarita calcarea GSE-NOS-MK-12-04C]|jgi:predicted site-specific integrase-resolvase|uniref:IS607 family transposase n=1 Tax=Cyanomargarita calcarea GSE-NOS-MK-12-04C TaxID=2839659 RepID=A0A951QPC9_9CYAN|nr:IS607 family transposase [Cyanomargarita calcarea GSE-NOS-MK-12-04C]
MVVYRPHEFGTLIGKSTSTLRRWDREGTLPAKRGKGNQRYYTEEDIANALNIEQPLKQGKIVVYYRVSTHVQKVDLEHQRLALETYALNAGIAVDEWVKDLGSGLNFKRKNFLALMKQVRMGEISHIIVAYKDRLCRFGFEFLEEFCSWYSCKITVVNQLSLSPHQELVEDLLAIIHCFSSRLYSLRKYKTEIKKMIESENIS